MHDHAALAPTIADAVKGGAPMVIVGGGDGTLSRAIGTFVGRAIGTFVGRDCVFAPLPLGTANSFARTLGFPFGLGGGGSGDRDRDAPQD